MNQELNKGVKNENLVKSLKSLYGFEDNLVKGKAANIGEIRNWDGKRYEKKSSGKWVEISEHGLSKNEHLKKHDFYQKKAYEENPMYKDNALAHKEASTKLSDKEHSDEEVGIYKVHLENDKNLVDIKRGDKLVLTESAKNDSSESLNRILRIKDDTFTFDSMAGGALRVIDSTGDSHILNANRFKLKDNAEISQDKDSDYKFDGDSDDYDAYYIEVQNILDEKEIPYDYDTLADSVIDCYRQKMHPNDAVEDYQENN